MWDIGMLAIGLGFFATAIAYVKGCELLVKKDPLKKDSVSKEPLK